MFPVIDVTAKIMCIPLESESADGRVDMWVSGPARRWPQFVWGTVASRTIMNYDVIAGGGWKRGK